MEVSESEWESKAVDNITKYLHRGGDYKGDDPQLIGGTDLLNTIGIAMGLPTTNPDDWTEYELKKALKGELVFFEGKAREAIDAVASQIRYCCSGDDKNFVTVLPVELYYEGKLYELPIFRAQRYKDSKKYYVDNTGRYYGSFSDWFEFNKLPPGLMAYPYQLTLSRNPSGKKAYVYTAKTPSARIDTKTARVVDTVAAVAGLGSSVALLFVSGGLAAPLVGTALATAGWGTSRATYQLAEKAAHGENINPFTNSESRMLWLGIAANLTSFGAMGASMRLTSLAARGKEISTAFKVFADIANGTNLAVSGFAILNSTIFMINNYEDMSKIDILMHVASIAFWTKGVYSYKTANTIIKEAQNRAFAQINTELTQEEANDLSEIRNRVQNDKQLLQKYHAAMKANISVKEYTRFLVDGMNYYDTVASMSPEQIEAFYSVRNFVKDDLNLISGLRTISDQYNLTPTETVEKVISMWQKMNSQNMPSGSNAILKDGNLILGSAPPIKINQLPQLSPPLIRFLGEHLSRLDIAMSQQWTSSVDVLIKLQSRGMFKCLVTKITDSGRAVLLLNGQLEISIYKLSVMPEEVCKNVFRLISELKSSHTTSKLSSECVKLCVREQRLRLECHRNESVRESLKYVKDHDALRLLIETDLKSFEKDRLYTFVSEVEQYKVTKYDSYMEGMMKFVAEMKPNNISELVAYSEFAMTCVEDKVISLKGEVAHKKLDLPRNKRLSDWTREEAVAKVFKDINALKQKFQSVVAIVERNDMVGMVKLKSNLSDTELVSAIKQERIRFGGKVSAAYHIQKHPTNPLDVYITRANETIHNSTDYVVSVGQDGDVRTVQFKHSSGRCIVLERDGRVFLCTFMPNHSSSQTK